MTLSIPPALRRHQRSVVAAAAAPVSGFETLEARRLLAVSVDAGGPYSFTETDDSIAAVLTLNATASGATGTANFTWDLNNDGVFSDGTGATLVLSSDGLENLGINQHRSAPYPIHVKVQDATGTATDDAELTVLNAPPQVDLFVSTEGGFAEGNTLDVNPSVTKDMFAPADASYTYFTVVTLDGVELVPNPPVPSATAGALGPNLNYTLPDDGASLQIVTTVTDEDGGSTIVHWPPAPAVQPVANVPVTVPPNGWSPAPTDAVAGGTFEAGVAAFAASVDTLTYRWRLLRVADGVTEEDVITSNSTHTFSPDFAGTYSWQVNISDGDGPSIFRNRVNFTVFPAGNEQATTVYSGQEYVTTTSSAAGSTATIALRAYVTDSDGVGDITRARVTFFDTVTDQVYAQSVAVAALAGSTNTGVAIATYTHPLVGPGPDFLNMGIRFDTVNMYTGPVSQSIVTVSHPDAGRVVGGGSVLNTSSGGLLAGAPGTRTSFGFHARSRPNSGEIDGEVELVFSSDVLLPDNSLERRTYRVQSTALRSLDVRTIDGVQQALLSATVDVYDVTDAASPVLVEAGAWLDIFSADIGKRGAVAFSLWAQPGSSLLPGGGLLFANNWVNGQSVMQDLAAGNLKIWDL